MRDLHTDDPGFRHLPPDERLARHGANKIRDRVDPAFTRADYDALCEALAAGKMGKPIEQGLDGRDVYKGILRGKKVRLVYDVRYERVVTVIPGWHDAIIVNRERLATRGVNRAKSRY